jgi:serine palmitoyltransferase
LNVIEGKDGTDLGNKKLTQLRKNCIRFKKGLIDLGFEVLGDDESPVICIMLYHAPKMTCFSRHCLKNGLAVVSK